MLTPLFRKLHSYQELSAEEKTVLSRSGEGPISFPKGQDIMREGSSPDKAYVLVEGWACRHKTGACGKTQIVAFLIPGDLCDIHISLLDQMDHSISTITPVKAVSYTSEKLREIFDSHPRIGKCFTWSTLVDEAILREWLFCVGRLPATEALAHLLCELFMRHDMVGLAHNNEFYWPLTQTHLSEVLGITHIHTNRALHTLRSRGFIEIHKHNLKILDWDGLAGFASFDPKYLHQKFAEKATKA